MKKVDLTGEKFGMLTVLGLDKTVNKSHKHYVCQCDCGELKTVRGTALTQGLIKACGCVRSDRGRLMMTKHGHYNHPLYNTWHLMMNRCYKAKGEEFDMYQGRGIKVCKRWHNFENFVCDMGERPTGLSLDRVDNNGDYKPSNCRWATAEEQANNTRKTKMIEYMGVTKPLTTYAKEFGLKPATVWARLNRGWSVEDSLTLPV